MTYLFDFDGTLVDSMPKWTQVMLSILDANGISYSPDIIKIITPLGFLGTAEYFRSLGVKMSTEEMLERMRKLAYEEYAHNIPAKPHVAETLRRLRKDGNSLNVLTASPHITLDICLKRLELYDLFDNVWSCDDFAYTKSQPEIYIDAAARLGVNPSECIFADDNYNAISAAKTAGMHIYGIYDASSAEFEADMRRISDRYISDFSEI